MKASLSLARLATVLLSASVASAWTSPYKNAVPGLHIRQDDTKTTDKAAAPTSVSTGGDSKTKLQPSSVNLNTGGTEPTASTGSGDGKKGNSTVTSHKTFDPTNYPGAVVMMTPAITAASPLYKIGDYVTFQWNYTNLLANPTAVDVLASCTANQATYTLTQNMTFATPNQYVWDTADFQANAQGTPLLTEQYHLMIFDSDSNPTATGEAGYLMPYSGLQFGLYSPEAYTAMASGWVCASCSGAMSPNEKRAIGFMLTMCGITVATFTWFVMGLGIVI